jgi:hypothetical protein
MGTVYRNGRLQHSRLGGETEHTWGLWSGHPPTQSPPCRSIDAENARGGGRAVRLGDATALAVGAGRMSPIELSSWPGYLALCEARPGIDSRSGLNCVRWAAMQAREEYSIDCLAVSTKDAISHIPSRSAVCLRLSSARRLVSTLPSTLQCGSLYRSNAAPHTLTARVG